MLSKDDWKNVDKLIEGMISPHLSFLGVEKKRTSKSNTVKIRLIYNSKDRNTGESIFLTSDTYLPKNTIRSKRQLFMAVRKSLRQMLLHEIDENLYLNDKRILDPHGKYETRSHLNQSSGQRLRYAGPNAIRNQASHS